jgi:hypothetical protein
MSMEKQLAEALRNCLDSRAYYGSIPAEKNITKAQARTAMAGAFLKADDTLAAYDASQSAEAATSGNGDLVTEARTVAEAITNCVDSKEFYEARRLKIGDLIKRLADVLSRAAQPDTGTEEMVEAAIREYHSFGPEVKVGPMVSDTDQPSAVWLHMRAAITAALKARKTP